MLHSISTTPFLSFFHIGSESCKVLKATDGGGGRPFSRWHTTEKNASDVISPHARFSHTIPLACSVLRVFTDRNRNFDLVLLGHSLAGDQRGSCARVPTLEA